MNVSAITTKSEAELKYHRGVRLAVMEEEKLVPTESIAQDIISGVAYTDA